MKKNHEMLLKELRTIFHISMGRCEWNSAKLVESYSNAFHLVKEKMVSYIKIAHSLEKSLSILTEGKLSTDLLNDNVLKSISNDLQNFVNPLQFPFEKNNLTDLEKVSELGIETFENHEFITVDIPLVKVEPIVNCHDTALLARQNCVGAFI